MNGVQKALLIVGLLNLLALGGLGCSGEDAPSTSTPRESAALTERIVRLEAWQMVQQKLNRDQEAVVASQVELNRSFQAAMLTAAEHAQSVGRTLTKQHEAMALLNSILMDLLKKAK